MILNKHTIDALCDVLVEQTDVQELIEFHLIVQRLFERLTNRLNDIDERFVSEYMLDFSSSRAARDALPSDNESVCVVVGDMLVKRNENIIKEKIESYSKEFNSKDDNRPLALIESSIDNYMKARQEGNTDAARTSLELLSKFLKHD